MTAIIQFFALPKFQPSRVRLVLLLTGLAAAVSASGGHNGSYRPIWIEHPKSDDSIYLFRVGEGVGAESAHQARAMAYENALNVILDEIMARCGVAESDRPVLRGRFSIYGVEPVPDAVHFEETDSGFSCWIQVSCPLSERERLLKEVAAARDELLKAREAQEKFDADMHGLWQQARAFGLRGEHDKALAVLLEIENQYGNMQNPGFALEEVRLFLGDTHKELKNKLAARAAYETVSGLSSSPSWRKEAQDRLAALPPPPRFWPMRSRWNAEKVALFCVIREGPDSRRFSDLVNILTRDCVDAHLDSVDVFGQSDYEAVNVFFDRMDFTKVSDAALSKNADIVLAVLYDIDPAKKGTTSEQFGVRVPVPDAVVRFFVVDPRNNSNIFNGQFREVAGDRPEHVLAERTALLLISRHLVPNCPAMSARRE